MAKPPAFLNQGKGKKKDDKAAKGEKPNPFAKGGGFPPKKGKK